MGKALGVAVGIAAAGVAAALLNRWLTQRAERRNPPIGRFITVRGVRLHYVDRGTGSPVLLLHGNGSMIEDFQSSGLLDEAAKNHRVIAFDRPGFGHSERPRGTIWTPQAQAELIAEALAKIGVSRPLVLGHSWGTLVATALAIQHPKLARALILVSGYYFPKPRVDALISAPAAAPIVGDVLAHTVLPLISRLIWPLLLHKIFAPSPIPKKFAAFPEEMAVRPRQLRAAAAETALMIPAAKALKEHYQDLNVPVVIVAGAGDQLVEIEQSLRLHKAVAHSTFRALPSTGHMAHQTATADVLSALDAADHAAPTTPNDAVELISFARSGVHEKG